MIVRPMRIVADSRRSGPCDTPASSIQNDVGLQASLHVVGDDGEVRLDRVPEQRRRRMVTRIAAPTTVCIGLLVVLQETLVLEARIDGGLEHRLGFGLRREHHHVLTGDGLVEVEEAVVDARGPSGLSNTVSRNGAQPGTFAATERSSVIGCTGAAVHPGAYSAARIDQQLPRHLRGDSRVEGDARIGGDRGRRLLDHRRLAGSRSRRTTAAASATIATAAAASTTMSGQRRPCPVV